MPIPQDAAQEIFNALQQQAACPATVGDRIAAFNLGMKAAFEALMPIATLDANGPKLAVLPKEDLPDDAQ